MGIPFLLHCVFRKNRDNTVMLRLMTFLIATVLHKKTPLSAKSLLGASVLYGVFPIDLIPDLLPFVGEMDDLTLIVIAVAFFWWKTRHVREELRGNPPQTTPAK